MQTVGEKIKFYRKERGLTQKELAEKTQLSRSHIASIEGGVYTPSLTTLSEIAKVLGVDSAVLLSEENSPVLTKKDERDIEKTLEQMVADLDSGQDGPAFYGGNMELTEYDREVLKKSLDETIRLIKLRNKEKYTPKKHRERDDYSL